MLRAGLKNALKNFVDISPGIDALLFFNERTVKWISDIEIGWLCPMIPGEKKNCLVFFSNNFY